VVTKRQGTGRPVRADRAVLVVVVLMLTVVGACGRDASPAVHRVTVVGDSLSVLGDAQIRAELEAAGWDARVDAFAGRTVAAQMGALALAARDSSQAIVIQLGTNDAHALAKHDTDPQTERDQISQALDLFRPGQCLVWVNADADPLRPGAAGGKVVDDLVAEAAQTRSNLHVADLFALLRAHPEYLLADEVHLTEAGSIALGGLMADALASCG